MVGHRGQKYQIIVRLSGNKIWSLNRYRYKIRQRIPLAPCWIKYWQTFDQVHKRALVSFRPKENRCQLIDQQVLTQRTIYPLQVWPTCTESISCLQRWPLKTRTSSRPLPKVLNQIKWAIQWYLQWIQYRDLIRPTLRGGDVRRLLPNPADYHRVTQGWKWYLWTLHWVSYQYSQRCV